MIQLNFGYFILTKLLHNIVIDFPEMYDRNIIVKRVLIKMKLDKSFFFGVVG